MIPLIYIDRRLEGGPQSGLIAPGQHNILLLLLKIYNAITLGGQVILDLQVIELSRVWGDVHQRYLASKPMPVVQPETAKGLQNGQLAA